MILTQTVSMAGVSFYVCGRDDDVHFEHLQWGVRTNVLLPIALTAERDRIRELIDVGANIGVTAMLAAKLLPNARILAVEASERTFESLCHTIEVNRLEKRVFPCRALVSSHPQTLNYQEHPNDSGLSGISANGGSPLVATTVDDLAFKHGFHAVDFVKIDAEGHDTQVFAGLAGINQARRPTILLELDPVRDPKADQFIRHICERCGDYILMTHNKRSVISGLSDGGRRIREGHLTDILFCEDHERFSKLSNSIIGAAPSWSKGVYPRTLKSLFRLLRGSLPRP